MLMVYVLSTKKLKFKSNQKSVTSCPVQPPLARLIGPLVLLHSYSLGKEIEVSTQHFPKKLLITSETGTITLKYS